MECHWESQSHKIRESLRESSASFFDLGLADFKTPVSLPGPDSCCGRCAVVEACNLKALYLV